MCFMQFVAYFSYFGQFLSNYYRLHKIFGSVRVNAHRPTSREALCDLTGLKWHRIMFAFLNFSTFTWSEVTEVHLLQGETNLK